MSRELRFVLILLGSIFAIVVVSGIVAAIFIGTTTRHLERAASPADRQRIAERMVAIPSGYQVTAASELFGQLSATLKSSEGLPEIILQSNTLPGASLSGGNADALTQTFLDKTMQLAAGSTCSKPVATATEQIDVRGRTFEFRTFACPASGSSLKFGFSRFAGRSGPVMMTVAGETALWDERPVRQILAGAKGPA